MVTRVSNTTALRHNERDPVVLCKAAAAAMAPQGGLGVLEKKYLCTLTVSEPWASDPFDPQDCFKS